MARILEILATPNPLAYKLRVDETVTAGGGKHYSKKEEAFDCLWAGKFFDIHGVQTVFLHDDTITITKTAGGIWDFILFKTQEILTQEEEIKPLEVKNGVKAEKLTKEEFEQLDQSQKLAHIEGVIDETIRPGLARDGGGLKILGLEGNTLRVQYQGACGTCPSSSLQTLGYISMMLQNRVNPDIEVVAV